MQHMQTDYSDINKRLIQAGIRATRQRILLGSLLWSKGCRHVSAEQLHQEAAEAGIKVSLATVYNTLHQFTDAGLLRRIQLSASKCFFDTNIEDHHHFLNETTGYIEDIPAGIIAVRGVPNPPGGSTIGSIDVIVRVK